MPARARALALTVIDHSAQGFTHWTVWNLSPKLRGLQIGKLPSGARQGMNDFNRVGYGGPCPPAGQRHRYVFTLYALSARLPLPDGTPPAAVESDIAARTIARATLVGLFR